MNYQLLQKAEEYVRGQWPQARPVCGMVCGSGWSTVAEAFEIKGALDYDQVPGLGTPGVAGHAGKLLWAVSSGIETLIFQGRRHWYEGEGWTPIALPIYIVRKMGAARIVLTNAAGGIRSDLKPGTLMVLDDHINLMGANPLVGEHNSVWGPRFPDQSEVYDRKLRDLMDRAAKAAGLHVAHGVYFAASGPIYETPSEIKAYRTLGADAVGMSTVPEAMLAHASGLQVAALSCISNSASGISAAPLSHEEVTATTKRVMGDMKKLLLQFWKEMSIAKFK